jgi:hypothetical protein
MANLTTAGAVFLAQAAINDSPTFFSSGVNAYLGVGSGTTAFAIGQTDLITPLGTPRKVATVTRGTNVLTFTASWATSEGNGAWEEVGIFNASSGGTMLARKAEALGTKTSAQVWQLTVQATFTAA